MIRTFYCVFALCVLQASASFKSVMKTCCERGRSYAETHGTCVGMTVADVESYAQICAVSQDKCCADEVESNVCTRGILTARRMDACDHVIAGVTGCHANTLKSCCDCCALGLKAHGLSLSCEIESLGTTCNKAYSECCNLGRLTTSDDLDDSNQETFPDVFPTPAKTTEAPVTTTKVIPLCETDANNCEQLCSEGFGTVQCFCRYGYQVDADDKTKCKDINECILGTHTCEEQGEFCLNIEGGYKCQRRISCGTGYELTEDNTCIDIDECALGQDNCGTNLDCVNIRGSFRCIPKMCDVGYFTDAAGKCIDIDECRAGDYSCPSGSTCENTQGSYTCRCSDGYVLSESGFFCEDINECVMEGSTVCDSTYTCFNTEGSYYCVAPTQLSCTAGYKPNEEGTICVDVDECEEGTHSCADGSTCINELGAYRCFDPIDCEPGFEPSQDQKRCEDINECVWPGLNTCGAGSSCHNTAGGYRCDCLHGFVESNDVTSDGKTMCEDVDECSSGLVVHKCQHECVNNPGSYSCSCPPGYQVTGFGRQCQDIDECAVNTHNCSDAETCFNTKGGFKCVELTCPAHYGKLIKRRCSRESCKSSKYPTYESRKDCSQLAKTITFHNISLTSGTQINKAVFRMSVAKSMPTDRYFFQITSGNSDLLFRVAKTKIKRRHSGVVYTRKELVGPMDLEVDLTLKLYRRRRFTTFVSRLYIFVSEHEF